MTIGHLHPTFDRVARAIATFLISGDEHSPFYLGTGVGVRLGGRVFVLTASHNVWEHGRFLSIAMSRPTDLVTPVWPGNGSAGRVHLPESVARKGDGREPDVAVVEPTPRTILPVEPFEEQDIRFFDTRETTEFSEELLAGREVVITGFPISRVQRSAAALPETKERLALQVFSWRGWTIPSMAPDRPTYFDEPSTGRGVHVYLSDAGTWADDEPADVPQTPGVSGGPLILPGSTPGRGDAVIGLVRSRMRVRDGYDVWCEPAAEAVRLLVDHEDDSVREAARRVVDRYDNAHAAAATSSGSGGS